MQSPIKVFILLLNNDLGRFFSDPWCVVLGQSEGGEDVAVGVDHVLRNRPRIHWTLHHATDLQNNHIQIGAEILEYSIIIK